MGAVQARQSRQPSGAKGTTEAFKRLAIPGPLWVAVASDGLPASFRIASESSALGALDEVQHVPTGPAVESSPLRVAVHLNLPSAS